MSRRVRGDGRTYLRGRTWWIQYSLHGKVIRESAHTENEGKAARLLRDRTAEAARGKLIGPSAEKLTLGEMVETLLVDYRLKKNRSMVTTKRFTRSLLAHFGPKARALDITSSRISEYIVRRQELGFAPASINRETSCLRHMFNLMVKAKRLSHDHVPTIPRLEEAPPRQGYLEPAEFGRLREALPEYLREPASFLYLTGWRKGAMRSLQWERDLELEFDTDSAIAGGSVTLQAQYAKNKTAVTLPLKSGLLEIIRRAWQGRDPDCPFVFHAGKLPIGDFRKAWASARKAVELDGILVHDMRRSSARNLVRSGTPERVVMAITGHKTRSMLDRYNITSTSDLAAAMTRVSEYVTARADAAVTPAKVIPMTARKVA